MSEQVQVYEQSIFALASAVLKQDFSIYLSRPDMKQNSFRITGKFKGVKNGLHTQPAFHLL